MTDIVEMAQACEGEGADALSVINTLTGMAIDLERIGDHAHNFSFIALDIAKLLDEYKPDDASVGSEIAPLLLRAQPPFTGIG